MHSLRFPSIPSMTFFKEPSILDTIFSPPEVDEGVLKEEFSLKFAFPRQMVLTLH